MGDEVAMEESKCTDNEYGQKGAFRDWEIKDAARDIVRAEEHKANAKLMAYVEKCLKADIDAAKKAFTSIADLETHRQELAKEEDAEGES